MGSGLRELLCEESIRGYYSAGLAVSDVFG